MKIFKVLMTAEDEKHCLIKAAETPGQAMILAAIDLVNAAAMDGNKISISVNPVAKTMKVVDAGETDVTVNIEEIDSLNETIELEVN